MDLSNKDSRAYVYVYKLSKALNLKVKPQPQIRPVQANNTLVDEDREVKKPKLDVSTDSIIGETTPSYSPLMKRQDQLEETVERRLQELENNIMNTMRTFNPTVTVPSGLETPKTKALNEMQRQLEATQAQLKELSKKSLMVPPLATVPPKSESQISKEQNVEPGLSKKAMKTKSIERPLCGIKRKKDEEFSCSPLFARPPRKFQRGFVSSASSKSDKENLEAQDKDSEGAESLVNSESQKKRNEEFLYTLNTASIKDLQSLQTIGAKRAKLIFEWRESYGKFSNPEDLTNIPGFTEKNLQKLLMNNLITTS